VNNAGAYGASAKDRPKEPTAKEFADYYWNNASIQDFTRVFEANVTGVFYTTLAFLKLLDAGNQEGRSIEGVSSQVITISSIGGFRR
jgi:NAD(P)-dependent dehydrogenase (short-subunit alcohol dehydrogenase family)